MTTIGQTLQKYKDIEIELLLAHTLKQPKEFLYLNPRVKITSKQFNNLTKLIRRRRAGEPIAYITGHKYFHGLKFKVNKQVLIPRPETEWLVERTMKIVESRKSIKSKVSILDMGTGSGCIAISFAAAMGTIAPRNGAHCRVSASDISPAALKIAEDNAATHNATINFIQSDLFKSIPGKFDIIIANLPYVPQGMYELLYHNLRYEPKVAITDGGEAWDIYQRFFKEMPEHLKPGGTALLEIDDGSKPDMQKMLKRLLPDWKARFIKDMGGLWRFIEIAKQ